MRKKITDTASFIEASRKVHGDKYDYSKAVFVNSKTKVAIICPEHGEFLVTSGNHVHNGRGCPECGKKHSTGRTAESVLAAFKKTHGDKYDYSKVCFTKMLNKVEVICPEHGSFWVTPAKHERGSGCPKCAGQRLSTEEFVRKARKLWGDRYDYSHVHYTNACTPVTLVCSKHGEFSITPVSHLSQHVGCPLCGKGIMSLEEFIYRAKERHGDKYDYSLVSFNYHSDKITIICPKHGEFTQTVYKHLNTDNCCPTCRINTITNEEFISRLNEVHGDKYDYSKVVYTRAHDPITVICPKHGEFYPTAHNHQQGSGCPNCTSVCSAGEIELVNFLKEHLGDDSVLVRDRKILDGKELDIYIPTHNLAIEYNGLYWHSEESGKDRNYHLNKTKHCSEKGIHLIHIYEDEWEHKKNIVKSRLLHILGKHSDSKVYARKCSVRVITDREANEFCKLYHIQGSCSAPVRLGLYNNETLVAVMTFRTPRFNKKYSTELLRYCTKDGISVVGGASKLLSYYKNNFEHTGIITYADRRWSEGNLYRQLGFVEKEPSAPSYYYTKGCVRFNRVQFQKHKLKQILPSYDPSLTEAENMRCNGYRRIYDCGCLVFVMQ